jgi:photosystem II stability/assembly factor-like uncharacterized protein
MLFWFAPHRSLIASFATSFALLALLVAVPLSRAAAASPPTGTVALAGETPGVVASGLAQFVGPHQSTAAMTLNLGLPLRNQAQLQDFIDNQASRRISMTQAEFDATYAPTAAQVQAVKDWATSNNLQVTFVSPDGLTIVAQGTTAVVQTALGVQIDDYQSPTGVAFFSTNRDPTVPASLGLQSISGLDSYHRFHTNAGVRPNDSPGGAYGPSNFQSAYDLAGHSVDGTGQTIGLTLWGAGVPDSDLSGFATDTGTVALQSCTGCSTANTIEWLKVNGNNQTSDDAQLEVAMDVEYAHGMALNSHLKYWLGDCTVDSGGVCEPSDTGLEIAVSDAANDPSLHVVSNSWGGGEAASLNDPFVVQTTNSFMHAVAVGTTFYFSSGDHASNSGGTGLPQYPADSPYVVAVGGTHLDTTSSSTYTQFMDESVWSTDSSGDGGGAGCSKVFPRPSWQIGVSTMATCTGRAEPDISAEADPNSGALVYVNGKDTQGNGGTSLAAPLVTGMAAVTNRYLSLHSKPLMGWAAPTMYSLASGPYYRDYFHDVQCGNNGYPAVGGWAQATGWGSEDWYQYTLGFAGTAPSAGPQLPGWGCQNSGVYDPNSFSNPTLLHVSCPTTLTCVAVGTAGTVTTTATGGMTWTPQTSGVTDDLESVTCPSVTICYASTQSQSLDSVSILKTTNGGVSWTAQTTPIAPNIGDYIGEIACTSTTTCYAAAYSAYVGTGGGVILQTTNGGTTWNDVVDSITDGSGNWAIMYGMSCPSTTVCYAVGNNGVIVTNASGTWTESSIPASVPSDTIFKSVACTSTSSCFVVGGNSSILHTTNSGSTWTAQSSPVSDNFNDIACTSATICTIVGGGGNILGTSNGGTTWSAPLNPALIDIGTELDGVACPDNSSCFAVGFLGTVLASNTIASLGESIAPGWNLLSLPRQLTGISSMSGLVNSVNGSLGSGTASALATYVNGRFQVYVPGYSADADLDPSQGIFIRSSAATAKTWTASGSDYPQGTPVSLNHGWNLVAAPYPGTGLTGDGIKSELGSACGLQEIATYSGGSYHVYTPGGGPSGSGFQVPATAGMWIECSSSGAWTPS